MVEESTVASFVSNYGESDADRIAFSWNGKHAAEFDDSNQDFRAAVTHYVLKNPGDCSVELLSALFTAHAQWSAEAWAAPINVTPLAGLLLSRGGPAVIDDFAEGLLASFDMVGACHQMSLDAIILRRLAQHVAEELAQGPCEERRRKLEAVRELFGKLKAGTAQEGWVLVKPGTQARNIRVVRQTPILLQKLKSALRRLFRAR